MAHLERHKLLQITYTCDTNGCHQALTGDVVQTGQRIEQEDIERTWEKAREEQAARDRMLLLFHGTGWSMWASRSVRYYCPDHGPKPGHRMRQIGLPPHLAGTDQ